MIKKNCVVCKKEFSVYPSLDNVKHCSMKCGRVSFSLKMKGNTHGFQKGHRVNEGRKQSLVTKRKISGSLNQQYKSGVRDRNSITKAANESIRKNGNPKLRGKPSWSRGLTKKDHPGLMRISLAKMGDKNPMRMYPEKHPNRIMARMQKFGRGYISRGQRNLFEELKKHFPDADLNHRLKIGNYVYFVDVGIPSKKIAYEYDGRYWHKGREKEDAERDARINSIGWAVIHIRGD